MRRTEKGAENLMTLAGNGERPTTYAIVAFLDLGAAPWVEKLRDK